MQVGDKKNDLGANEVVIEQEHSIITKKECNLKVVENQQNQGNASNALAIQSNYFEVGYSQVFNSIPQIFAERKESHLLPVYQLVYGIAMQDYNRGKITNFIVMIAAKGVATRLNICLRKSKRHLNDLCSAGHLIKISEGKHKKPAEYQVVFLAQLTEYKVRKAREAQESDQIGSSKGDTGVPFPRLYGGQSSSPEMTKGDTGVPFPAIGSSKGDTGVPSIISKEENTNSKLKELPKTKKRILDPSLLAFRRHIENHSEEIVKQVLIWFAKKKNLRVDSDDARKQVNGNFEKLLKELRSEQIEREKKEQNKAIIEQMNQQEEHPRVYSLPFEEVRRMLAENPNFGIKTL